MATKKPPSILIVDDDPAGRAMLGLSLRQAGYRVQSAQSGLEALELLKEGCFDWMVTDGRMSPMDGFELSLRAKALCPRIHVIMISAVYDGHEADHYPIEKFFSKPIALEQMLGWIGARPA